MLPATTPLPNIGKASKRRLDADKGDSSSPPPERTTPPPNVGKAAPKWSLYADKEDSTSPPPEPKVRKPRSNVRSKAKAKSKSTKRNEPIPNEPDGGNEMAKTRPSGPTKAVNMDGRSRSREHDGGDADEPQDGLGNPNLSGITLPHPAALVEPQLQVHDTGFYVITSGTEVGITTVKGIADSRLVCDNPSSMTFSTWRQARSYYNVCFMDGSVAIRSPQTQNPVQSPAHKRQKIAASPTPISHQYTPLSFPSSPEAPPLQSGNNLTCRRIVVVEDSSDENPSANDTAPTISLPGPSSSAGSVIIVSDSEEEEEEVTMPAGCFTIDDDTLRRELQIIADYRRKLAEYHRGP